jgi:tRNA pseudouridine32 synthase/23S rRNA pseudouridine746 synthase/23S rRNA pseudouridine1911/1915/1917 synthase
MRNLNYAYEKPQLNKTMPKPARPEKTRLAKGLSLMYEDRDILVVNKPAGVLSVGVEAGKSLTAHSIVTNHVRKGNPRARNRVFIVHRLDRDTSGVLLFAKSDEAKQRLQDNWNENTKKYLAVVHGKLKKESDTISSYLAENKAQVVYSTTDETLGKLSHTAYKVLRQTKYYALLEVDLLTGRKNQIRVHLADIGHPIVGDQKYGLAEDRCPQLALHAQTITFQHPHSGQELTFSAEVPAYFIKMVGKLGETGGLEKGSAPPERA